MIGWYKKLERQRRWNKTGEREYKQKRKSTETKRIKAKKLKENWISNNLKGKKSEIKKELKKKRNNNELKDEMNNREQEKWKNSKKVKILKDTKDRKRSKMDVKNNKEKTIWHWHQFVKWGKCHQGQ